MNYTVEYFHPRVKAEIENWPDGIQTQDTPEHELKIARKRMKEVQNG